MKDLPPKTWGLPVWSIVLYSVKISYKFPFASELYLVSEKDIIMTMAFKQNILCFVFQLKMNVALKVYANI